MPDLNLPAIRALLSRNTVISGIRIPVMIIAVPGFVLIWMAMIWFEAPAIEAELQRAVNAALSESGYARIQSDVSGRDVILSGKVSSPLAGTRATSLAAAVTGVRVVTSIAEVVPLRLPYLVVRRSRDGELVITGQIPNPEIAADMLQRVSSNIRHRSVVSKLAIDPEVTPPPWTEVVMAVAQEANHLQGLEFEIGAGQVAVGGLLDSKSDYTVLTHRLLSLLEPAGTVFINRIGITPRKLDLAAETIVAAQAEEEIELEPDSPVDDSIVEVQGSGEAIEDLPEPAQEASIQPGVADAEGAASLAAADVEAADTTDQDAETADTVPDNSVLAAVGEESLVSEDGSTDEQGSQMGATEDNLLLTSRDEASTLSQCQSRISDLLLSDPITFSPNIVELSVENTTIVNKIYIIINECPTFNILVAGHTDSRGSEASNLSLSQQRAASVMEALLDLGVDKSRLDARGFGSTIPVASNETSDGRRLNRRIEIILKGSEQG